MKLFVKAFFLQQCYQWNPLTIIKTKVIRPKDKYLQNNTLYTDERGDVIYSLEFYDK